MANTYYDSDLTGEQIEQALEAIDGVIVPANNGKVLAISNGKLEARSVQWGGGSAVVQPLSVTQNGTYNPPSGVDGYAPVVVNVSGGGGEVLPADYKQVEYAMTAATGYTRVDFLFGRYYPGDIVEYTVERDSWPSGNVLPFGSRISVGDTSTGRLPFGLTNNKKRMYCYSGTIHATEDPTAIATGTNVVTYGDTITSGKFTQSVTLDSFGGSNIYYIYLGRYGDDPSSMPGNIKIYGAKVVRDGANVFNAIPCVRIADDVCGFYEMKTRHFYTPTEGSLTAGPDVN